MANVFNSAGVRCGHEGIFSYNSCTAAQEWLDLKPELEADSSWMAAPCLGRPEFADVTVIHLVRHPKRVIDSYVRMGFFENDATRGYRLYMHNSLPLLHLYEKPAEKAAVLYLAWNAMIDPWANIRHRVEDDPYNLLSLYGICCNRDDLDKNTRFNHRGGPETNIQLKDFPPRLEHKLYLMTREYGYGEHWPCE